MSKTNEFVLPRRGSSDKAGAKHRALAGRGRRALDRVRSLGTEMPDDTGNKFLPWTLVGLAVGFNLWVLRAEVLPVRYLNDSAVHFSMVRWALDRMQAGHLPFDGWYPNLGLGSSLFHRYQSLPHILTASLGMAVGADRAFTGTLYLLLSTWPISVYLGARLLGWERWAAAGAAVLSPLITSTPGYGFEHGSYSWRGLGVWSELWGMWMLPIAWGLSWRAVNGRAKRYSWAALAVGMTAALHFIVGYAALLVLPIWVLVKPSEFRKRFGRALLIGLGALLIIAWVTVPLLLDAKYSTHYRYLRNTFWTDSWGARKVLGWLFTGKLFDGSEPVRLPVLSVLVALGALLCIVRARRDERARVLLGALALGFVLFSGRPTFGFLVNLIPGNSDLLLHRFIFVMQMAGLLMAGVAFGWLAGLVMRFAPKFEDVRWRLATGGVVAGVAILALAPAWSQIRAFDLQGDEWVHTQRSYDALEGADVDALVAEAKDLGPGRFYAGASGNWGKDYKVWSVPIYNYLLADDADAIGFYLRTQSLSTDIETQFDDRNATQVGIFNIRYMILPAGQQPAVPGTLIDTKGSHSLWEMDESNGYLQMVDALPPITADRTNLSAQVEVWMRSSLPALGKFPTIAFAGAPGAPSTNPSGQPLTGPAGVINHEFSSIERGIVSGSLDANRPAMVMLKVSYDPRWTVTVDGQELPVQMVAPSFVGREVPAGHHEIVFSYHPFPRYDVLFALGALVFFGLHFGPRWWAKRRGRRREPNGEDQVLPAATDREPTLSPDRRGIPWDPGRIMGLARQLTPATVLSFGAAAVALVALIDLGIRSAVDLNLRWDTFSYHIPFAALRGGLHVPYDMNDTMKPLFEGFPPLPDLVQGVLWRLTGSVNATGVVNFVALAVFLVYCHIVLHARFWLVALIALTAPMVLIHTTVSYTDLFSNAWLAIGAASCIYVYLFPADSSRAVLVGGLAGLAAAAWSKYQLVPIAALIFVLFAAASLRPVFAHRFGRRQVAVLLLAFGALASIPYARNFALYGNPFWPEKVPVVGGLFPYQVDSVAYGANEQRPASLKGAPQAELFVLSLFEIHQPTYYPNRPRWIIDQGNAAEGFRMGGFWGTGTMVYLVAMVAMLIISARRAGIVASIWVAGVLGLTAFIPQSNELRYFMYIPLTWAATIGMLYPRVRDKLPRVGLGFVVLVLALFSYMVSENWAYYQIQTVDYQDAADAWGASKWWALFSPGETYCVVDMLPIGILMTGPTMSEYSIVDRSSISLCPPATIVVTEAGIQGRLPA